MNRRTLFVIGLTGDVGSGKDTCAEVLRAHGYGSVAFADALRAEVAQAWRIDPRMLTDRATKEWAVPALSLGMCCDPMFLHWAVYNGHSLHEPRSARWVLQRWAEEYRCAQDPDYFVRIVERQLHRAIGLSKRHLVVTDVRKPNELDLIHQLSGRLLRVHRPDNAHSLEEDTANYASHKHQLYADEVIHNDSTLDALPLEVERVVRLVFPQPEALHQTVHVTSPTPNLAGDH